MTIMIDKKEGFVKPIRIVVTGGPCGGKSTALAYLKKTAEARGYLVLVVGETATELIGGGVAPWTCESNAAYQACQLHLQKEKERVFVQAAAGMESEKILILLDRGLLDNRAYMTEEEFAHILALRKETQEEYLAAYDAVFHLVTAAEGAEAFYTTANNAARTETPEEARRLDARLREAWSAHPYHIVIANEGSFADKMKRLADKMNQFLDEAEVK